MINITDASVAQVKTLGTRSQVRISIQGGGCSGLSYKLEFDDNPPASTDKVFEKDGISVVVDAKSFLFLDGSTLDYEGGLNGTGFQIVNPNAKRTCGCGSSFSA